MMARLRICREREKKGRRKREGDRRDKEKGSA
jgi:hypothetical protein